MYPFPAAPQLERFVGDAIAQVSFDPYAIQLSFESMSRLTAEQRIEHVEADGAVWAYDCKAANGPPLVLHRLLYKQIVAVEREDLRLTFRLEDGSSLAIFSEDGPYESGQIETADGEFIVF